jgi:hypothetical protein
VSVTYEAVLDVSEDTVLFLSGLLHAERLRRGTRKGRRRLSTYKQAVLVLCWFLDDPRMSALARDNGFGVHRLRVPRRRDRYSRHVGRRCTGRCWPGMTVCWSGATPR